MWLLHSSIQTTSHYNNACRKGYENGFYRIGQVHRDLVIARIDVEEEQELMVDCRIHDLINLRQRKIVFQAREKLSVDSDCVGLRWAIGTSDAMRGGGSIWVRMGNSGIS